MPAPIRSVAILGTGAMGQGIAQVTATAGVATRLFDTASGRAQEAAAAIASRLEGLVARGKMAEQARARAVDSLGVAPGLASACADVDLVVESVPEQIDLKVDVLERAVAGAPRHALVASNTSSLSITEIGARAGARERTLGMHFFNPAPVVELVEIVRGLETAESAVETAVAFAAALGKTPIVVRDVAGFASSRLGVLLGAEAVRMLESGVAEVVDIDRAMELGYRHPMGPLKLTDLVGLDVRLAILEHLHAELGERFRPPALLRQMVRAGRLGKKTGEGFYTWVGGVAHAPARRSL